MTAITGEKYNYKNPKLFLRRTFDFPPPPLHPVAPPSQPDLNRTDQAFDRLWRPTASRVSTVDARETSARVREEFLQKTFAEVALVFLQTKTHKSDDDQAGKTEEEQCDHNGERKDRFNGILAQRYCRHTILFQLTIGRLDQTCKIREFETADKNVMQKNLKQKKLKQNSQTNFLLTSHIRRRRTTRRSRIAGTMSLFDFIVIESSRRKVTTSRRA